MPGLPHPRLAIAAFALLAAGSVAQSPSPASFPPIAATRAADSYAIYSLLISDGSIGNVSRRNQQVAIADTTLTIDDGSAAAEPDSQLQPPSEGGSAFQEALQDYHARSQERVQLEHRFNVDRPYTLLSADQVAQFRKTLTGYPGIALFSGVDFNAKQTAALVYIDTLCRNSCPSGRWIYLEKRDGQWHRRSNSADNSADTYAIYSLLLHDDPYPGLPQKEGPLAIADTTINITDMNPAIPPDGQLQPPPNNADAFHEAVQDFQARRFERLQLKRSYFHLDVDYTLLNPGDVAAYKSTQSGYPAINFFSEVYFNSRQTAALVYRSVFCGRLCANGQWIYLEKQGNQWVRRSGLDT